MQTNQVDLFHIRNICLPIKKKKLLATENFSILSKLNPPPQKVWKSRTSEIKIDLKK